MKTFLSQLQWRHATKVFDETKKLKSETLDQLLKAIQLTPTSFGLQPYKVLVIVDQKIKEKLLPHSWNQPQITSCSHLLVFVKNLDTESLLNQYKYEALEQGVNPENLTHFEKNVRQSIARLDERWAENQAFIALGFALAACAELEIDSCAIGGFDALKYDEILTLPPHLKSCVVLPIGYRKKDPERPKVRLSDAHLFDFR